MPRPKEVTAYVTRTKRASRFSADKAANAVRLFLPLIENATEEAAQRYTALAAAEIAETDPARRGYFEEAFQKIGAIRRLTGELALNARQLIQAFRELEQSDERIASESEPQPTG